MSIVFGRRSVEANSSSDTSPPFDIKLRVSYDRFDVTSVGEPAYDVADLRLQMNAQMDRQHQEREAKIAALKAEMSAARASAKPKARLFKLF